MNQIWLALKLWKVPNIHTVNTDINLPLPNKK